MEKISFQQNAPFQLVLFRWKELEALEVGGDMEEENVANASHTEASHLVEEEQLVIARIQTYRTMDQRARRDKKCSIRLRLTVHPSRKSAVQTIRRIYLAHDLEEASRKY